MRFVCYVWMALMVQFRSFGAQGLEVEEGIGESNEQKGGWNLDYLPT